MPTNDFELDAASATTALGPVNFLGQDLPSLGDNWSVETQFTVQFTGGWQHAGLIVWQGDNNFFRSTITHSLSDDSIYVEQSKDNPSSTEGARVQARRQHHPAAERLAAGHDPDAVHARPDAANTVIGQYRVIAPGQRRERRLGQLRRRAAGPSPADLNLATTGARRDSAGSRIGIIATGNFPGSTGTGAYTGTPGTVAVDYFRVTPDPITCETDAPTTTATLDPAAPATGDTYNRVGQGRPVRG